MEEKIKDILNRGIVVLDTNVYLNIYERSPEFSNFSIEILDKIKDKIIIPSTVRREYLKHHSECFNRQYGRVKNACKKLTSQLSSVKNKVSNQCNVIRRFKFPDIDEIEKEVLVKIEEAIAIVDNYEDEHDILRLLNERAISEDKVDDIFNWIVSNGHVLDDLTVDEIYSLSANCEKRFIDEIPPGFKDSEKIDGISKYGDYFIWEEIIKYAKDNKVPVIFVTDDEKRDWFEGKDENKKFHSALEKEFADRVGTSFIGLSSLEFYKHLSNIYSITQTGAIEYALNYTTKQYIENLVNEQIIYSNIDKLLFDPEKFVDIDSLTSYGYEGLDISEDLEADYIDYEIYEITDDTAVYDLKYNVKASATSYEYWGRDDDTKEVITSPGRIHNLEGQLIMRVYRDTDPWLISEENDSSYIEAELLSGELKEVNAYDVEELCSSCKTNPGIYEDYFGDPICEECMVIDERGEICTACGKKVPRDYMYDDRYCIKCAEEYDD